MKQCRLILLVFLTILGMTTSVSGNKEETKCSPDLQETGIIHQENVLDFTNNSCKYYSQDYRLVITNMANEIVYLETGKFKFRLQVEVIVPEPGTHSVSFELGDSNTSAEFYFK